MPQEWCERALGGLTAFYELYTVHNSRGGYERGVEVSRGLLGQRGVVASAGGGGGQCSLYMIYSVPLSTTDTALS